VSFDGVLDLPKLGVELCETAGPQGRNQAGPVGKPCVGSVRDLGFGDGSLWVISGNPSHVSGVVQALRRLVDVFDEEVCPGSDRCQAERDQRDE